MKKEFLFAFMGYTASALIGALSYKMLTEVKTAEKKDPFTKVGVLATQNGLIGELFSVDDCFILVTTSPSEAGRGMFQLHCK